MSRDKELQQKTGVFPRKTGKLGLDEKRGIHERERVALTALFRTLLHQLMTAQIRVHDLHLSALEKAVQLAGLGSRPPDRAVNVADVTRCTGG